VGKGGFQDFRIELIGVGEFLERGEFTQGARFQNLKNFSCRIKCISKVNENSCVNMESTLKEVYVI